MWLPPSQPLSGSPDAAGLAAGWTPLDATKVLHSPHWSPHLLVGTVLDGRFRLERYMQGCSGAYGHPFQGTELATGQPVFVKVLCGPAHGHGYSVERELETVRGALSGCWGGVGGAACVGRGVATQGPLSGPCCTPPPTRPASTRRPPCRLCRPASAAG